MPIFKCFLEFLVFRSQLKKAKKASLQDAIFEFLCFVCLFRFGGGGLFVLLSRDQKAIVPGISEGFARFSPQAHLFNCFVSSSSSSSSSSLLFPFQH